MIRLIIARHGNTFGPKDTPTRVGKHTDLPLVDKGREQGRALGQHLRMHDLLPDVVYSSTLQRTQQTARSAMDSAGLDLPITALDIFDEVDYGPDENQPEDAVIARIGKQAIHDWDSHAIVPAGWAIDPEDIKKNWKNFSQNIVSDLEKEQTILVVTSNGIARFAPYITEKYEEFVENHTIKLSTGAFGILEFNGESWVVSAWNTRPAL